ARARAARREPAPPAAFLRDSPPRRRRGPTRRAGDARARRHRHDAGIHRRCAHEAARAPSSLSSALETEERSGDVAALGVGTLRHYRNCFPILGCDVETIPIMPQRPHSPTPYLRTPGAGVTNRARARAAPADLSVDLTDSRRGRLSRSGSWLRRELVRRRDGAPGGEAH